MSDDNPLIDPDVRDELEDMPGENPHLIEYGTKEGTESDGISFAESWFPDTDEWQGKTNVTEEQAHALSMLRAMTEYYDELEDVEPFMQELIDNYEKYLTSVDGRAREQQSNILRAVFGDSVAEEGGAREFLGGLLSNPPDEEDE